MPLSVVDGPQCRLALAVVGVGLEHRPRTLPLCSDHSPHRATPDTTHTQVSKDIDKRNRDIVIVKTERYSNSKKQRDIVIVKNRET